MNGEDLNLRNSLTNFHHIDKHINNIDIQNEISIIGTELVYYM